ncbi:hypothetical protein M407DRAFT_32966 [Tulasnella calospora MUT 4182]|uniref:LNS2/PITP domain-containing protein n=1 Tax=Tulasnella calospora MUT 4182 TaxID=1051891 RepID=A0A0C3PRU8_9AGAM|nr:hypothetical protein M407DRAFT_32966 [Tulasnella calospora MUT 4182]
MAGYQNAEAVGEEESDEAGKTVATPEPPSRPFPSASSSSPPSTSHLPLPESKASYVRGGSALPDVQVTIPKNAGDLSTSPPDYTWEWGAFPTRSPARPTFKPLMSLRRSLREEEEEEASTSFGRGGHLFPDDAERDLFRAHIEEKKFSFQLSLCDNDEGRRRRFDDLESARWFNDEKVEYAGLLADRDVAASEQLVMKWGDRFITRRDNSPLMTALLQWRHDMKPIPESQPCPPIPSSASDPERTSPPISSGFPAANVSMSARDKRVSGSSWARWWSRSRAAEQEQEPVAVAVPGTTSSAIGVPGEATVSGRPPFVPTASGPVDLDMPEVPTPVSPPMDPSKTAPASIAIPSPSSTSRPDSPSSDQLRALDLQKRVNTITFSLAATGVVACTAKIFVREEIGLWSDALEHMFNLSGRDWTHLGVAKLYTNIARNGYKMIYLTSRAIGLADSTKDYLKGIKQNNYQLPEGPVIMSPDREVIMRKPEVFKMACLGDTQRLFEEPFYARFRNRITDALSYQSVNVPSARIFTIDSSGEVKMELLELAEYKIIMFPPVHKKWATEFTDFKYWRDPLPDVDSPDLDPPSPALSAVSDTSVTSRLSRLRNFSLRSSSSTPTAGAAASAFARTGWKEVSPSPFVRSAISDDRSTTMPGSLPGSEYGGSDVEEDDDEDEDDDDDDGDGAEGDDEVGEVPDDDMLAEMGNVPFI